MPPTLGVQGPSNLGPWILSLYLGPLGLEVLDQRVLDLVRTWGPGARLPSDQRRKLSS